MPQILIAFYLCQMTHIFRPLHHLRDSEENTIQSHYQFGQLQMLSLSTTFYFKGLISSLVFHQLTIQNIQEVFRCKSAKAIPHSATSDIEFFFQFLRFLQETTFQKRFNFIWQVREFTWFVSATHFCQYSSYPPMMSISPTLPISLLVPQR